MSPLRLALLVLFSNSVHTRVDPLPTFLLDFYSDFDCTVDNAEIGDIFVRPDGSSVLYEDGVCEILKPSTFTAGPLAGQGFVHSGRCTCLDADRVECIWYLGNEVCSDAPADLLRRAVDPLIFVFPAEPKADVSGCLKSDPTPGQDGDTVCSRDNTVCSRDLRYVPGSPRCFASRPATARKDPHFVFHGGGRADIRGEAGARYNLLSHSNISMGVLFEAADFVWSKRLVHGTKMAAAYWVLRTPINQTLRVELAPRETAPLVKPPKAEPQPEHQPEEGHLYNRSEGRRLPSVRYVALLHVDNERARPLTEGSPFVSGGVAVSYVDRKLSVATPSWSTSAQVAPFPFAQLNRGKLLLDVSVLPLVDVESDATAPHGLLGQSFDGSATTVDGARDVSREAESVTKAQGEGAIEGVIDDYRLTDKFSTTFAFSRFDGGAAKPRDVTKLRGAKHMKSKATGRGGASGVSAAAEM